MNYHPEKMGEYRRKDIITVLCGIPLVATFAIVAANFVTSYNGI